VLKEYLKKVGEYGLMPFCGDVAEEQSTFLYFPLMVFVVNLSLLCASLFQPCTSDLALFPHEELLNAEIVTIK